VFVFCLFLAPPLIDQRTAISSRKLTVNELNLTWIVTVITVLTTCNIAIFLYICTVHSTSYLRAVLPFINPIEHNSTLYVQRNTIVLQIFLSQYSYCLCCVPCCYLQSVCSSLLLLAIPSVLCRSVSTHRQ
jgi:hypothetical protein